MTEAEEIVNKALAGDDNPSTYVDWLGKKEALGSAGQIRFGIYIHTTDEETVTLNAKEDGTVTDRAFWNQINDDARWLEENAAVLARELGLYVQGEGHGESGEYVGSVWVSASLPPEQQVAVVKKILEIADGEMPSTTSGTYWKYFPGSNSKLYQNVNPEVGAKYLDVAVEFTGTDALAEWLKLNTVTENLDDEVERYVDQASGEPCAYCKADLTKPLSVTRKYFGNPHGEYSIKGHYDTEHYYLDRGTYKADGPYDPVKTAMATSVVDFCSTCAKTTDRQYAHKISESTDDIDCAQVAWDYFKKNGGQLVTIGADGFWGEHAMVLRDGLYFDRYAPSGVTNFLESPYFEFTKKPGMEFDWKATPMTPAQFQQFWAGQITESEDVDNPEGYLDKVTGWIDTFLNAGMTRDTSPNHENQFFKKFECNGANYWIYVHVRRPLWLLVLHTNPKTGQKELSSVFTFAEDDTSSVITQFNTLDKLLTQAKTRDLEDWHVLDAEIVDLEKQNDYNRMRKLNSRKISEAVDDPEIQSLLDKASPEPCFACYADLTQPFSVIRTYAPKVEGAVDLQSEGHYSAEDGYFVPDEKMSQYDLMQMPMYNLPDDCDNCAKCGNSTAKSNSRRNESVEQQISGPELEKRLLEIGTAQGGFLNSTLNAVSQRNFKLQQVNIADLFKSDEAAAEAITGMKPRDYEADGGLRSHDKGDAVEPQDLYDEPIVIIGGEIRDGYSRIKAHLDNGDSAINAWVAESVDDVNPQHYVDQIHDLAAITHEIQNFGMFVNRIHPWGRWIVLSGGAYWATLHGEDREPLKADFFQQQIDHFMRKLGITKYYTKLGQTGTDNEHVWYQLGIPKSQLEQESWQPFIRNTSWPEASEEIAKWLPEAADPDDPSVNVDRHLDTMDADKVLTALGFSQYRPAYHPTGFEYWENFDFNTGLDWHAVRKSDEEPHIIEVRIYRSVPKKVNNYAFADKVQIGGFSCHIGELPAKLQKAKAMKWYVKGDDTVWHKNVQLLNGVQEAFDPDSPEANVDRHTAALDVNAVLTRFGFKKDTNWDLWLKTVGNKQWRVAPTTITNVYSVLRLKRPAKFVQIGRGRRHGQWSDEGSFTCHATELEQQLREEGALNESLDPDAPEPNIERFADHTDKVAQAKLGAAIDDALVAYEAALQRRGFNTARQADELAAEMGAELAEKAGYPNGSDEFDHIVSALSNAAGTLFPGDWEDYPVQEGAEDVTDWTDFLSVAVDAGKLSRKDAIKYQQRQNPEANEKIYNLFIEMDEASQAADNATALAAIEQIAHTVRATNMRYGSAILKVMRDLPLDENEVDPEKYIKQLPLEIVARIKLDRSDESMRFDAEPWFSQATLEQMIALSKGGNHFGFERSNEADDVARFFADTTLHRFFQTIEENDEPFEVTISIIDAKRWIEHNRPDWYPYLWPDDMVIESVNDPDAPESVVKDFVDKDLGITFYTHKSGQDNVIASTPFRNDWIVYSDDKEMPTECNQDDPEWTPGSTRTWEGYLRQSGEGWLAYPKGKKPIGAFDTQNAGAYAIYKHNRKVKEGVDDPNPQFMQDTFDVPTILKRMGYEQHSPASPWFKVFNRMPTNLDLMIEVQRRGLGGEHNEADVVYDTTLYHSIVKDKEWAPIAHRYKRNNKQLEPMLKALEARVKANNLRGVVTDPGIETNPEFDDFVTEPDAEPEVNESVDDPDDPSTVIAAHTQDLVTDPDDEKVKINKHPHGEAEAELKVLGFEPSWIAGKNTVFGEPEIPNFWSKRYRSPNDSAKSLFLKINPYNDAATVSVRTRAMSIPVLLKPRSMAHVITIIKDVDAAVQRAADNSLTKEQEIDAVLGVLDHHRQWCHPS